MRSNITQVRKFDAGRPKNNTININRRKFSSNLSDNYEIILQIYCLSKQQAATKKELKYGTIPATSGRVISKPSYPILSTIVSFFTVNFSFNKKAQQEISLVAE